ncbi:glucokinase [Phaeovulum sp.]|uniref:glucokinase n=1 Tax=Phaeovulum sp. TaxID=2934796 RepID=UPI0039E41DAA
MSRPANHFSLVADIGGTNTRVGLSAGGRLLPETIRRYANAHYGALDAVLGAFMAPLDGVDCASICVAVAGPVRDGVATLTNLDWTIDPEGLAAATGAKKIAVLNDLQAHGHALGHLHPGALRPILTGHDASGNGAGQLVIGVGTGFNAAPVHNHPRGQIVVASECGHASLPIRTETDLKLLQFIDGNTGFPAIEDVLSGRGLEQVYAWVTSIAGAEEKRPAAAIMAAMAARDPLALSAGQVFGRLLGVVVGDLALIHLPLGGIYLCGGVARAISPFLGEFGFARAFYDKGRFCDFMQRYSIFVIEDDFAALTGCAVYLQNQICAEKSEGTSNLS